MQALLLRIIPLLPQHSLMLGRPRADNHIRRFGNVKPALLGIKDLPDHAGGFLDIEAPHDSCDIDEERFLSNVEACGTR